MPERTRPYAVAVQNAQRALCSGTLVSKRIVVTAAHCYQPDGPAGPAVPLRKVLFGATLGPTTSQGVDIVNVPQVSDGIRIHPQYNVIRPGRPDAIHAIYDVAVVRLVADPPAGTQAVPLMREILDNTATTVGPEWTFIGYGYYRTTQPYEANVRRVITFPIRAVGGIGIDVGPPLGALHSSLVYYANQPREPAQGDSGGPSFLARFGVERLAAVTSFGEIGVWGTQARTDADILSNFIQPAIDAWEGPAANPANPCRSDGICQPSCQGTQIDLVDPDCASQYCAADGVCALACVQPIDPDCKAMRNLDYCQKDGACDPNCASADPDCPQAQAPGMENSENPPPAAAPPTAKQSGWDCALQGAGNAASPWSLWLLALGLAVLRRLRVSS